MLDVRLPALLREVALQGSFSAAAQALTYSQSAVSQQIATLEREAGARLVERNGRSVRLTDAGRALVRRADAILAAHPGVRVELTLVEETAEAVEGLRAGRTDLALLAEPLAGPGPVETHHLLDDPMLAVLPAGHPLARRRALRLPDLAAEPWVLGGGPGCSDRAVILRACHASGFEPRVGVEFPTDNYHATQGMVAAGAGITLLPRLALSVPRDDLMVRPLAGQGLHRQVVAATRRGDQAPATRAMLEAIRDTGRRLSGS